MTVLLIIVAVLASLLLLKLKIVIEYADEVYLTLRILGLPFRIFPKREKKVHVGRYSLRKMRKKEIRRRRVLAKQALADKKKAALKKQRRAERKEVKKNQPKAPLGETVNLVLSLVKTVFSRFGRHLRIDLARLCLTVASGDAAQTAILWGAVYPAVGALLEILDRITNLRTVRNCIIRVEPDFTAETFSFDLRIAFSLRVWQILDILLRALFSFLRSKIKASSSARPSAPAHASPSRTEKSKPTA